MAKDGENENLEITVHGVKAPVGFIARTFFPDQTASAEALATLSRTATEKNVRGLPLTPEEAAAFSIAMAPIWKKAARVRALVAQADKIYSSATKALPAPSVGTRAERPPEGALKKLFAIDGWPVQNSRPTFMSRRCGLGYLRARFGGLAASRSRPCRYFADISTQTAASFVRLIRYRVEARP